MAPLMNNINMHPQESTERHEDQVAREIRALGPHIHSAVPNPAPIGLFAFGLTTALLQMKHTRLTGNSEKDLTGVENLTWGFAMFYGGLLQLIAGLGEVRRNNLFGYTAFLSYGGFWMSLGTAEIITKLFTLLGEVGSDGGEIGMNPDALRAMVSEKGNQSVCPIVHEELLMQIYVPRVADNDGYIHCNSMGLHLETKQMPMPPHIFPHVDIYPPCRGDRP